MSREKSGLLDRVKDGAKFIFPIFKHDSVSAFTDELLEEHEDLRENIKLNPGYRAVLEQEVSKVFKEYSGVLTGARLVDSWDRVSSALGLAADALGPATLGTGYAASAIEEVAELIPKALYAVYYGVKTGDIAALPKMAAIEAASFIPYLGDVVDMQNHYIKMARNATKRKVAENIRNRPFSGLEEKVQRREKVDAVS